MLLGFLSDPHANLPALEVVLEDVDRIRPDELICLGDFVGYGPHPNEVVEALRDRCHLFLAGNHDLTVLGAYPTEYMNPVAAAAIRWTREQLTEASVEFLQSLTSASTVEGVEVAHASLRDPVWEYILNSQVAAANFAHSPFATLFVGHTHVPAVYWMENSQVGGGRVVVDEGGSVEAPMRESRLILNPGGVGQPRDGDPRASWATWETISRTFAVRRLPYDIPRVQADIRQAGLPGFLAERLASGV